VSRVPRPPHASRASTHGGDDDRVAVLARADEIVIAYKPARWATEPTPQGEASLVAAVGELLGTERAHAASRLDVGVSGLVVCTVGNRGARKVAELREAGRIGHEYLGIAAGLLASDGRWSDALGRARDGAGRARAVVGGPGARAALTEFTVIGRAEPSATLLRLRLATGRMHQIRAHASAAGHPLVGDRRYGGPTSIVEPSGRVVAVTRLALHCCLVEVGDLVKAAVPPPADLRQLWRALGGTDEVWPVAGCDAR
jgi:23S rRNA-/tRNA-specific pseudouridylate synthase